jgi:hypothetical protein
MQSPDGRECSEFVEDKKIKLSGKHTSTFYFLNPQQREVEKIQVDDCAITDGPRCDWMVVLDDTTSKEELFVELKGTGVSRGVEQVLATIETLSKNATGLRKRSFVVFNRNPMSGTDLQKFKKIFLRDFNSEFDLKRSGSEVLL